MKIRTPHLQYAISFIALLLISVTSGFGQPVNDNCPGVFPIYDGITTIDNSNATTDASLTDVICDFAGYDYIGNDLWYLYTPGCNGPVEFQTCGSTIDTKIAIYEALCPTTANEAIDCNDDFCSLQSLVSPVLTGGVDYLIRIGTWPPAQPGEFDLTITPSPCPPIACLDPNPDVLVCNNLVQISLDDQCQAEVTLDMILEGDFTASRYDLVITTDEGSVVPSNILTDYYIGMNLTATVNDICNGNSCWGNIIVEDKLHPEAEVVPCPPGQPCTFLCSDEAWIWGRDDYTGTLQLNPIFIDNCDNTEKIHFYDEEEEGEVCGDKYINRKWIYKYIHNGQEKEKLLAEQRFYLRAAMVGDVKEPNSPVFLPCGADPSMPAIAAFHDLTINGGNGNGDFSDDGFFFAYPYLPKSNGLALPLNPAACNLNASKTDSEINVCGSGPYESKKILRDWTVLDWCKSETRSFFQVIKILDQDPPELYCPDPLTVGTSPYECTADFELPYPYVYDYCYGPVDLSVWVVDHEDVNIVEEYENHFYVYDLPKGDYTFVYHAIDECGNESQCKFRVTIIDDKAPFAVADLHTKVSLTQVGYPPNGQAIVYAESLDDGSWDNCSEELHFEIRRDNDAPACGNYGDLYYTDEDDNDYYWNNNITFNNDGHSNDSPYDTDYGAYVKFCCEDLTEVDENGIMYGEVKVWLRVWDDGDMDGYYGSEGDNYSDIWTYVRVEDKFPAGIYCPPDITVNCYDDVHDPYIVGHATSHSTCGDREVGYYDQYDTRDVCGVGHIKRVWFVEDGNGGRDERADTCVQHIWTKNFDYFVYEDITWPVDQEYECISPDTSEISWNEKFCSLIGATVEVDSFFFEDEACLKILKRWTVIDWCQYEVNGPLNGHGPGIWHHTQVIKVIDDTAPTFETCQDVNLPADEYCRRVVSSDGEYGIFSTAVDNGDCPSDWLKWTICLDIYGDYTCDHIWTSTGNPAQDSFDNVYYIHPTSSGEEVRIPDANNENLRDTPYDPTSLSLPKGYHLVRFDVFDGCGNYDRCEYYIHVVDEKPPTPYCVTELSTAVMNSDGTVKLWASDFNFDASGFGSFDNCTPYFNLRYSFTDDVTVNCREFTCDDIPNGISEMIELDVYVWDENDNYDYCTVTLLLEDNEAQACEDNSDGSANIAGVVRTANGDGIENVTVTLDGNSPEYPVELNTGENGTFVFPANPMGYSYSLSAMKNDDHNNGISTLDLVLIQQHILSKNMLDSPYKVMAADVNSDEKISGIDLVQLRKLILGIYGELPSNTSWRFVDAMAQFDEMYNPWPFTEVLEIPTLDQTMLNEDFIGMKVGDVSGNAAANNLITTEIRTNGTLTFTADDQLIQSGEQIRVGISADNFDNVLGFQYTMDFNGLTFESIEAGAIEAGLDNIAIHGDRLAMSWNTSEMISTSDVLFTLVFTSVENGKLSDVLSVGSEITVAESYAGADYNASDLALELRSGDLAQDVSYKLHQNEPNPFSDMTVIGFELPEAADATITVYDVTGKLLHQTNRNFAKGYNEVEISRDELQTTGLLYYELSSGSFTAAKKMILMK